MVKRKRALLYQGMIKAQTQNKQFATSFTSNIIVWGPIRICQLENELGELSV